MATRRRRRPATNESAEAPSIPEAEPVEAEVVPAELPEEPAAAEEEVKVEVVQEPEPEESGPDFGEGHGAKLRAELYRRGRRFFDLLSQAQAELTPENVHQLRVTSRRLSSTLALLSSLVGKAPVSKLRSELRKARRSLGVLRDLQRQLEWLSEEPLLDDYLTERAAELPKVIKKATQKLGRVKPARLEKRLELVDALLAALLEEEEAEDSIREALSRHVWESLLEAMAHADEVDPDHSFSYHPLRVGMKNFRYQAEVFAATGWPNRLDENDGWDKVKELHDALGHLQDLEVLSCHLDLHWVQTPPIRESQARVVNRLLKERNQTLARIHLQDLDWESLWEWPTAQEEELEVETEE